MKTKSKVFIISAVRNDLEYTKELLRSINNQKYSETETIIVDDGSIDGTARFLKRNYPEVRVLRGDGSLWWTGSIFWAIEEVLKEAKKGDYILTINNDCTFNSNFISNLISVAKKNKKTIVGSLIIEDSKEKRIIDAGVEIDWSRGSFDPLISKAARDIKDGKIVGRKVDALPTKGTLFPIKVFRKVGNFDKKHFPHYLSDYEFTNRAKKAGFPLLVSYEAEVYNKTKRTGIGGKIPKRINFKKFLLLLFSRGSRVNIIDQWQFIRIACPPRYKVVNYFTIFAKTGHYLLHVPPFTVFPWLIKQLKERLGLEDVALTEGLVDKVFRFLTRHKSEKRLIRKR